MGLNSIRLQFFFLTIGYCKKIGKVGCRTLIHCFLSSINFQSLIHVITQAVSEWVHYMSENVRCHKNISQK